MHHSPGPQVCRHNGGEVFHAPQPRTPSHGTSCRHSGGEVFHAPQPRTPGHSNTTACRHRGGLTAQDPRSWQHHSLQAQGRSHNPGPQVMATPQPAGTVEGRSHSPAQPAGTVEGRSHSPAQPAGIVEGRSHSPAQPAGTVEGRSHSLQAQWRGGLTACRHRSAMHHSPGHGNTTVCNAQCSGWIN